MSHITSIDSHRRLLIPEECGEEFAPEQPVELVRCEDGLLIRPLPASRLADVLRRKVSMNQPTHLDLSDLNMDEIGW
jgi:hypothetical protein